MLTKLVNKTFSLINKVKRLIGLGPRQTGNKLIITVEKLEKRVALLENGILEEYNVERANERNIVGSIFKGRVRNIEQGLKAMFVDIGYEKMRSCISGTRFPRRSMPEWRKSSARTKSRSSASPRRTSRASTPSAAKCWCR